MGIYFTPKKLTTLNLPVIKDLSLLPKVHRAQAWHFSNSRPAAVLCHSEGPYMSCSINIPPKAFTKTHYSLQLMHKAPGVSYHLTERAVRQWAARSDYR